MSPDDLAEFLATEVRSYVDAAIAKALAALPPPIPGPPGVSGEPGPLGHTGAKGEPGAPGDRGGTGERGDAGRDAIAKDGRDGRDGKDGITEERLEKAVAQMEERTAERIIASIHLDGRALMVGDRVLRVIPIPEYRDVYRDGEAYEPGDVVSWGGSGWICKEATSDKPGDGATGWRLFIKRGRDAREPERVRA